MQLALLCASPNGKANAVSEDTFPMRTPRYFTESAIGMPSISCFSFDYLYVAPLGRGQKALYDDATICQIEHLSSEFGKNSHCILHLCKDAGKICPFNNGTQVVCVHVRDQTLDL